MSQVRVTLHLTEADRELLDAIETRRAHAAALVAQAEHEFAVASIAMATSRGLRRVSPVDYNANGLTLDMAVEHAE